MKYHVTITDNETGEVLRDMDSNAIAASIDSEDFVAEIFRTHCTANDLVNVVAVLMSILEKAKKRSPWEYRRARKVFKKLRKQKENNNNE
jgi:hypothetical protein